MLIQQTLQVISRRLCILTIMSCAFMFNASAQDIIFVNSAEKQEQGIKFLCKDIIDNIGIIQDISSSEQEQNDAIQKILQHTIGNGDTYSWVSSTNETEIHSPVNVRVDIIDSQSQISHKYYLFASFLKRLKERDLIHYNDFEICKIEYLDIDTIYIDDSNRRTASAQIKTKLWQGVPNEKGQINTVHIDFNYDDIVGSSIVYPLICEIHLIQSPPKNRTNEKNNSSNNNRFFKHRFPRSRDTDK